MKRGTLSFEIGPWRGIGPGRDLLFRYFDLGWLRVEVTNDRVSDLLDQSILAKRLARYRAALDAMLDRIKREGK